jgi:hypothetical protein
MVSGRVHISLWNRRCWLVRKGLASWYFAWRTPEDACDAAGIP